MGVRRCIVSSIIILLLVLPASAWAHPVISEVMWMGSDLSTSDEWLEITNPDDDDIDVSNWAVTSLNSSAKEIIVLRFITGSVLAAGETIVIARLSASNSRLAAEPFAVSSTLTLPNTKLLLRIRDGDNAVIDEVDDGAGSPFAGDNPSGTDGKASMERIDLFASGTVKENWKTSMDVQGFDDGAHVFGTPGSVALDGGGSSGGDGGDEGDGGSCTDPLEIAIAVQSGPLIGVGKVTVNFQAVATVGSLSGVACRWNYGDGFTSQSCNPPSHSFVTAGTYTVRLEAENQCGNTLLQEQNVVVQPDPSVSGGAGQPGYYDGSRVVLLGALPNPEGTDTGKEWIEIKNLEEKPVDLRGWKLSVGETTYQWYTLKDSIGPRQTLRIYNSELKFTLPNTLSKVRLVTPSSLALSSIPWPSAAEGQVYRSDDLKDVRVFGRVLQVTGPLTFRLELNGEAASLLGEDTVTVRVLGLSEIDGAITLTNEEAYEYFRALIENKNIELEFDSDLWDPDGRLLAYVSTYGGVDVHTQMIVSKLWKVDSDLAYAKKENFLRTEKSVWPLGVPDVSKQETAAEVLESSSRDADLRISEVYPSPFPESSDAVGDDWKTEEWLEIDNKSQFSIDLSGWSLESGKKKKPLPLGLRTISGSYIYLRLSLIKLGLKNAGDTVRLLRPDGSIASEVSYPSLKNGLSYALQDDGTFCTTLSPTPGETNACVAPLTKQQQAAVTAVKRKATAVKKAAAKVKANAAAYRTQVEESGSKMLILKEPETYSGSLFFLSIFVMAIIAFLALLLIFYRDSAIALLKKYVNMYL